MSNELDDDRLGAELDALPGLTPDEIQLEASGIWETFLPVVGSDALFITPAEDLSIEEATLAFLFLKFVEETLFKERRNEIRSRLLELARACGERTAKGGNTADVAGNRVIREIRQNRGYVDSKVDKLLKTKKLARSKAFSKKISWGLDVSKLEQLVETGVLTPEELEACRPKKTEALRVLPSDHVKGLLEGLQERALPPKPEP